MSYLKSNVRNAGELDVDAVGGGLMNFLEGSMGEALDGRLNRLYGGLVMFSINDNNSGLLSTDARTVLSNFYGATLISNIIDPAGTGGFKVVPVGAYAVSELSHLHMYAPTFSISAGNSNFVIVSRRITMSTGPSEVIYTLEAASISQHIVGFGFIASAPFRA